MPLIVIEGLDGSGKATSAALLEKRLTDEGKQTLKISFPDYESESSALVKMYLSGKFGDKPQDVNAYAASAFYAVDRYAGYKSSWGKKLMQGAWVIADRYTTSNAVHQASKLDGSERDAYLDWLYDFEFEKLGLPRPDCVIYLDVPPKVSQKLMATATTETAQERIFTKKTYSILKKAAQRRYMPPKGSLVYCQTVQGRQMLPSDAVLELIYNKIKDFYGDRFTQNNT